MIEKGNDKGPTFKPKRFSQTENVQANEAKKPSTHTEVNQVKVEDIESEEGSELTTEEEPSPTVTPRSQLLMKTVGFIPPPDEVFRKKNTKKNEKYE